MSSPLSTARLLDFAEDDRPTPVARPHLALVPSPDAARARADQRTQSRRTTFAIVAMLASTALFPMSDMMAKTLAESYSGIEVAWMRFVVLVAVVAPIILRNPALLRTARPSIQIVRGLSSAIATALALAGFTFLPVADATAIGFVTPLIVTALAVLILKEQVGWRRWSAAFIGFCGILIIVQPGTGTFQPATLLPLTSSLFSAATVIVTRLGKTERIETTLIYSALVGFVVLSVATAFTFHMPSGHSLLLAGGMGLLAAGGSLLQLAAYRAAPSSLLAPFSYVQLICAGALGWLVFGTVPGPSMLVGASIIVGSGLFVAWRERVAARQPHRRNWSGLRKDLAALHPRPQAAV